MCSHCCLPQAAEHFASEEGTGADHGSFWDGLFDDEEVVGDTGGGDDADDKASAATEEDIMEPDPLDCFGDDMFAPSSGDESGAPHPPPGPAASPSAPPVADDVPEDGEASTGVAPAILSLPSWGPKGKAAFVMHVEGGKLSYYSGGQLNVCAECRNPTHARCVMTRKMVGGRKVGQGRPLGFLLAWLAKSATVATKDEHWSLACRPTFAERKAARDAFKLLPDDDAKGLLAGERPKGLGEDSEPEVVD